MSMMVKSRAALTPRPVEQQDYVPPPAPPSRPWLPFALTLTVIPALGLGVWWYFAAGPGAFTTVPDGIATASAVDAQAMLTGAGLEMITVEAFDPKVPEGQVISTSLEEGTEVRKDGTVTVTVSKGPDMREVWVDGAGMPAER